MRRSIIALLLVGLSGCVSRSYTKVFPHIPENLKIIEEAPSMVDWHCHLDENMKWHVIHDDFGYEMEHAGGCFHWWSNIIYVPYNPPWCLVAHELCHASRYMEPDQGKYCGDKFRC